MLAIQASLPAAVRAAAAVPTRPRRPPRFRRRRRRRSSSFGLVVTHYLYGALNRAAAEVSRRRDWPARFTSRNRTLTWCTISRLRVFPRPTAPPAARPTSTPKGDTRARAWQSSRIHPCRIKATTPLLRLPRGARETPAVDTRPGLRQLNAWEEYDSQAPLAPYNTCRRIPTAAADAAANNPRVRRRRPATDVASDRSVNPQSTFAEATGALNDTTLPARRAGCV